MAMLWPGRLSWRPDREALFELLPATRCHRLRIDRFLHGVDNAHIDVDLGDDFFAEITAYAGAAVREDVYVNVWNQTLKTINTQAEEAFSYAYLRYSEVAIREARRRGSLDWVQLYQLALLKTLLGQVDDQLDTLRHQLDAEAAHAGGQALQVHERMVRLARARDGVRHRAIGRALRLVMRLEHSKLRKVRKTLLGRSWPLCEIYLRNPLVQLGGLGGRDDFLQHYPLAFHALDDLLEFTGVLAEALARLLPDDFLPMDVQSPPAGSALPRERRDQGGLPGYGQVEDLSLALFGKRMQEDFSFTWFETPEAIPLLFGQAEFAARGGAVVGDRRLHGYCEAVAKGVQLALAKAGQLQPLIASYDLQHLLRSIGPRVTDANHFDYAAGRLSRRALLRRLADAGEKDPAALVRRVDEVLGSRHAAHLDLPAEITLQGVQDLVRLRRDIAAAHITFAGMDRLRVLRDADERALSSANGLLQVFSDRVGVVSGAGGGHVILKADVRGSTAFTARMREKNLNPAAYFSRNLYDPITALLREYGAHKVFVEGDAVILTIAEQNDLPGESFAVARACGLARKILGVVDAKNAESSRLGLPALEIGIGIAYSDEPPTYLYDEGHRITISPAINVADRLSSCERQLRSQLGAALIDGTRVDMVARVPVGSVTQDSYELLRYNVNGVAIETAAFHQLSKELPLRRLALGARSGAGATTLQLYAARYPDARGNLHWLLIREAVARISLAGNLLDAAGESETFYEVISDPELIARARKLMGGAGETA